MLTKSWGQIATAPDTIKVWVNSNADAIELFLNGVSLGKKTMHRHSHLKWPVVYQPGELKAIAYKNGRTFSESRKTSGPAVAIQLSPSKTVLLADGEDAVVMNVSVVDTEGNIVPNAQHKIAFSLEGDGQIIGTGNGDPSSHEPDKGLNGIWERSLFNGRCQVILQGGSLPGKLLFRATAPNLKIGETKIQLKK